MWDFEKIINGCFAVFMVLATLSIAVCLYEITFHGDEIFKNSSQTQGTKTC